MNEICRFCLSDCKEMMCDIVGDSSTLNKIRLYINLELSSETSLPRKICRTCTQKMKEITQFCAQIKQNEEILLQYLQTGTLEDFYNTQTIKKEFKHVNLNESNINKSSIHNDENILTKTLDNRENNEVPKLNDDIKIELNTIKMEPKDNNIQNINETSFSSDDNLTLSSIKNTKETNKKVKNSKKYKKIKKNLETTNNFMEYEENKHPNAFISQINCLMCTKQFLSNSELIKHYNKEHLNINDNKSDVQYKEINRDGDISFKCDICEKVCSKRKYITKHIATHNKERPFVCKLCGRTYKNVSDILRHGRVHSGFKYQCVYKCGYGTAYSSTMKAHELKHKEGYKYKCETCNKGFHVKTWYEQHQNIHDGVKPFICDICGAAFAMDRYLTSHRSSKHPQTLDIKRYECVHCGEKCDSTNSLNIHLQEHGIKHKQKGFLCDFCGKILSTTEQVKYHHRMHAGVKLFPCSICNKAFSKKINLQLHERSHTGEKKHTCTQCGKRYAQKSTLTRHINNVHEVRNEKK